MKNFKEWLPVKATNEKTKITAEVWNRTVEFDKSIFPTSVKVAGKEILYAPIRLNAEFSDIKGEWDKHEVIFIEKNEEKAVYTVTQTAENLIVNATVTIEFDGFIKVDFQLLPFWTFCDDNKPRLTHLSLDIPVKNEFSTLMHYWPNCESGVCLSQKVINSYATPNGESSFMFKPYLWTGWEYGGFGFICESDKGFEIDDKNKCMTITRTDEYTNMHIAILDNMPLDWQDRADDWGNTIKPICFSFGFQATPVKPFNEKHLEEWRAFHLYDVPKYPIFEKVMGNGDTLIEKIAESGAKWIILHEDWTVIQNYGLPENEGKFKTFVKDCHNLGLKVMTYFGYELSTLYPYFNDVCDEYLNKNTKGNFVGGWQRPPMQRDFTVCYNGPYSDVMIERVIHVMDNYGVDGIYTDGTYVPWECANEAHGCGYRDNNGELKYRYPVFAVREHAKKLYSEVHKRGGIIDTHQSSCCLMATLGFADSYFDGENIQTFINDDIKNLKMVAFRAEFLGLNMGIPCNFITYISMELIAGITLIHNVYPRANNIKDLPYISHIWKTYDNFGTASAQWIPYYENSEITTDTENTYISYYKRDGKLLLVVTSYDEKCECLEIKLDKEYKAIKDLSLNPSEVEICGNIAKIKPQYTYAKIIEIY